jgi:hypothetical protein
MARFATKAHTLVSRKAKMKPKRLTAFVADVVDFAVTGLATRRLNDLFAMACPLREATVPAAAAATAVDGIGASAEAPPVKVTFVAPTVIPATSAFVIGVKVAHVLPRDQASDIPVSFVVCDGTEFFAVLSVYNLAATAVERRLRVGDVLTLRPPLSLQWVHVPTEVMRVMAVRTGGADTDGDEAAVTTATATADAATPAMAVGTAAAGESEAEETWLTAWRATGAVRARICMFLFLFFL